MNLSVLWKKVVASSTLSDSEKEVLYAVAPDALQESVFSCKNSSTTLKTRS